MWPRLSRHPGGSVPPRPLRRLARGPYRAPGRAMSQTRRVTRPLSVNSGEDPSAGFEGIGPSVAGERVTEIDVVMNPKKPRRVR
ncbi:hypothetical protein GCM10017673_49730 [Streptosporangium violaceochromogenes]|nr:hypothetical protein GCM10017673_49730 [Streptosporangium violaceochromogenes]